MAGAAGTQWPDPRITFSLSAHVSLIAVCFGSIALAASGWTRRRSAAMGAVAVMAIAAYLVELLEAIWAPARDVARFSPFHYLDASGILAGTAPESRNLAVLGSILLAATALAYWRFNGGTCRRASSQSGSKGKRQRSKAKVKGASARANA